MSDVQARLAALEAQLEALKAEIEPERETLASRRDLVKKAALGVAGLAAAGAAGAIASAGPAAAIIPTLQLGVVDQDSPGPTGTRNATPGTNDGVAYLFQAGNVFTNNQASYPAALAGWSESSVLPNGVYGYSSVSGGAGVAAVADSGYGLLAYGSQANMFLSNSGVAPPLRVNAHATGEIIADTHGDLWYCVVAGTPGKWRKLAGSGSAGAFHLANPPGRVFDSRSSGGKHVFGTTDRVVTVTTIAAGNPNAGTVIVPAGATAIVANFAVTQTEGSGYLGAYSNAVPGWPGIASINWFGPSIDLSNHLLTAIDSAGKIKVTIGGVASAKTHFIIDVLGYFL